MIIVLGTVEEIIYCNEANGYTICDIKCDSNTVTAVGYMPFISLGETLKISGKWVVHPDYGEQLKVELYEKVLPQSPEAVERYLGSGIIKGVGPATAHKIVEQFGEGTLDIIRDHPEQLSEIKGVSLEKALRIGQALEEQRELGRVVMFFQEYGISPAVSTKIYRKFGERAVEEIRSNPYRLTDEGIGVGFRTADRIARGLGIDLQSRYRICSGIRYVLSQAAVGGHTFVWEDKLRQDTGELLEIKVEDIQDALVSLVFDRVVYIERSGEGNRIYLSSLHNAELGVCKRLAELAGTYFKPDLAEVDRELEWVQQEEHIELAELQKNAVREALCNGVTVITGGPGTGKTTIIKTIIRLLQKDGHTTALAAPTGRAAKRMTEAAGFEARTIHRLLEIGFMGDEESTAFLRNESNPIEADVIIIDEMSMVDILLMNNLLKAVRQGTRLILVGDADQLPSVGPGNVLKDIIGSRMIPTVKLTCIFRQAEESMITVNAHRINRGETPLLNVKEKDFFFMKRSPGEQMVRTIVELCSTRLPKSYDYDPLRHIQVLTPTRKGTGGVAALNTELQKILNPPQPQKGEKVYGDWVFRQGDRVMQVKNNYNLRWEKLDDVGTDGLGVFNGDTGIIQTVDLEEQYLAVVFDDDRLVEYDFSILDELELAYAITIHKSQGSEFPVVILPMFPGPQVLMTRNLLYTAVTRARELVVLVGDRQVLEEMTHNERETGRNSGLEEKLRRCGSDVL